MRIPEHIIEEVRSHSNIVDVIGEHVQLRKAGRNYLGLCPFHKERTPSFNVNPERGLYKCFGCGKAGNAISFIQEHLHLGFIDAVKHLAEKTGIVIPEEEQYDPTGIYAQRDAAFKALREAAEFYSRMLRDSKGALAHEYFQTRGFNAQAYEDFLLGASINSWDALFTHLRSKGFEQEHLVNAGLLVVREDGKVYDRFRNRAMFALRDDVGRVVGFSARILVEETGQPKYINSPQGICFDKSRILYGLDRAKRAISEHRTAIVVEGQADVVTLHQHGFTNTVASSGTSLTNLHVRLLKKYADTIILVFDADNAGQNAMTKAIELALPEGVDVQCVALPLGTDPDSLVRTQGAEAFQTLVNAASSWLVYQTQRFESTGALENPVQQANAVRTMLGWISSVPDAIQHAFLVRNLASQFKLQEGMLFQQLQSLNVVSQQLTREYPHSASSPIPSQPTAVPTPTQGIIQKPKANEVLPPERELLRIALHTSDGLAMLLHTFMVTPDWFITSYGRTLFHRLMIAEQEHHDVTGQLINDDTLSAEEQQLLATIAFSDESHSPQWQRFNVEIPEAETQRAIRDALLHLEILRIHMAVDELFIALESEASTDTRKQLMYSIQQLIVRREELKKEFTNPPDNLTWLETAIPSQL